MSEEPIEKRTLIQESPEPEAVSCRCDLVVAVEPKRFGKPGESAAVVTLFNDASPVVDIHPHQPPADFPGLGIGQQSRFVLTIRGLFFATSSRSSRFGQRMLMNGRYRSDDRDGQQERCHAQ